ncbi:MAG: hypothetical protein ACRDD1_13750 [Planctomycetia bacterium]
MNLLGVLIMILANGAVIVLMLWCFFKVMTAPTAPHEPTAAVLTIDTRDADPPLEEGRPLEGGPLGGENPPRAATSANQETVS